jgi:hypothetical protein
MAVALREWDNAKRSIGSRRTWMSRMTSLGASANLAQRIVIVVGLAAGLTVFGSWLTGDGTLFRGWTGYAPLGPYAVVGGGLPPWARLLIRLGLILVWLAASLWLLRVGKVLSQRPPGVHDNR